MLQVALRRVPFWHRIVRKLIAQVLSQVKSSTTLSNAGSVFYSLGTPLKQTSHHLRRLEEELIIGTAFTMGVIQGGIITDCHEAVLKAVALLEVVVDVARGDDTDTQFLRQINKVPVTLGVSLDEVLLQLQEIVTFPKETAVV
jgi:hypothetical protein